LSINYQYFFEEKHKMLKVRHTSMIIISGMIWMGIGTMLLSIGLGLLVKSSKVERLSSGDSLPLIDFISPYIGGLEQAALIIIAISLIIGYFKGKFVLGKSANRGVTRIRNFPNPTSIANIYSMQYYILLAGMVGLGFSIKYMGIPNDIRGAVDVAIGAALINGAMIYFRHAATKVPLKG